MGLLTCEGEGAQDARSTERQTGVCMRRDDIELNYHLAQLLPSLSPYSRQREMLPAAAPITEMLYATAAIAWKLIELIEVAFPRNRCVKIRAVSVGTEK